MDMPYDDIVLEIFSWLPAKSLYRFKCVNKFCNTISSPENSYFNQKQSHNALLRDDCCFFLQPNWMQRHGGKIEFHHLSSKNTTSGASHGFFQFLKHYRPACRIIASSNGLILGRSDIELFICNPVTQSWLPIQTPEYMEKYPDDDLMVVLDFNVEDSKDFMLFLFEVQGEWGSSYLHVKLYSVKERMWKSVEAKFFYGGRSLRFDTHVYYRKALHFISDCFPCLSKKSPYFRPYIMAYTIGDGSSRMIRIPKEARRGSHDSTCQMRIYKWGKPTSSDESICLVRLRKNVFTIWVLADYEIGKWRRVLKIRVKAMGVKEEDHVHVTGFIVMNGDQLIFATEMKTYGYGLSHENFMKFEEICEHGFERNVTNLSFIAYSDTLHPCGHNAVTLPLIQQD
ncbi:hypothetical protein QN277_010569 [Acacia crassicarpa]|uniref:F-box domain-containing protein n=1 Tax=Acacia crassicarpa TaxID=499986 RepID=A0AAE1ILZ9_9FABA|nr:hypothetical protein QN277_010569 [Acacia crassicarpa]